MFEDVVTVYNRYKQNGTERWQRTVLQGVYSNAVKGANFRKTGVAANDSVVLIIPHSAATQGEYRKPKEWEALADKTGFWTLQSGDTVVKGALEYEVERSAAELKQFDDVLTITSVDHQDHGGEMAHWEVGGR